MISISADRYAKDKVGARDGNRLAQRAYRQTIRGRCVHLINTARASASRRHLVFDLDADWLVSLWERQTGACAMTGIKFDLAAASQTTKFRSNPFSPSLDRKVPCKGYTKANVRLVCSAVNYALNEFGDELFAKICKEFLKKQKLIKSA